MLLVIDIGNTSTTFGLFDGKRLIKNWRVATNNVCRSTGLQVYRSALKNINGIIISSVVPKVDKPIASTLKKVTGIKPVFVNYKNAGVKIGYPKPKEIGADRLVAAVATVEKFGSPCIVIDFGTATTLDYIDKNGRYLGGTIAPGLGLANELLSDAASRLPRADIIISKKMIPKSTKEAMQSGVYQGYIGLVERLVKKTIEEVGGRPKIVATGGYAKLISKGTPFIKKIEPNLTLEGLRIIWNKNPGTLVC